MSDDGRGWLHRVRLIEPPRVVSSRLRALTRIVFIGETSFQVRNEQSMHDSFVLAYGIYVAGSMALGERRQFDPRMAQIMVDIRPSSIGEQFENIEPHVGYRTLFYGTIILFGPIVNELVIRQCGVV